VPRRALEAHQAASTGAHAALVAARLLALDGRLLQTTAVIERERKEREGLAMQLLHERKEREAERKGREKQLLSERKEREGLAAQLLCERKEREGLAVQLLCERKGREKQLLSERIEREGLATRLLRERKERNGERKEFEQRIAALERNFKGSKGFSWTLRSVPVLTASIVRYFSSKHSVTLDDGLTCEIQLSLHCSSTAIGCYVYNRGNSFSAPLLLTGVQLTLHHKDDAKRDVTNAFPAGEKANHTNGRGWSDFTTTPQDFMKTEGSIRVSVDLRGARLDVKNAICSTLAPYSKNLL
jgi:hypothetical protein